MKWQLHMDARDMSPLQIFFVKFYIMHDESLKAKTVWKMYKNKIIILEEFLLILWKIQYVRKRTGN